METKIYLTPAKSKLKKIDANIINSSGKKKKISFGSKGASDYTINKNPKTKSNYIKRHQVNEDWNNLNPGSFSRYLLWNKPTLSASIKDMEHKFKVKIINKMK
jgi:hypothetical protein